MSILGDGGGCFCCCVFFAVVMTGRAGRGGAGDGVLMGFGEEVEVEVVAVW